MTRRPLNSLRHLRRGVRGQRSRREDQYPRPLCPVAAGPPPTTCGPTQEVRAEIASRPAPPCLQVPASDGAANVTFQLLQPQCSYWAHSGQHQPQYAPTLQAASARSPRLQAEPWPTKLALRNPRHSDLLGRTLERQQGGDFHGPSPSSGKSAMDFISALLSSLAENLIYPPTD